MKSLYLWLDLGTLSVPLLCSFYAKAPFYKEWKRLLPAIGVVGVLFIAWDVYFTSIGVWGFNPNYILGIYFLGLPIEEWLFFLCVPYSCLFIYFSIWHFKKEPLRGSCLRWLCYTLAVTCLFLAARNTDLWYTMAACFGAGLSFLSLGYKNPPWLGHFLLTFVISLLPFFLVNGILTGSWIQDEVVWYNNEENSTIRILTIPIEDNAYSFTLLASITILYEFFKAKPRAKLD